MKRLLYFKNSEVEIHNSVVFVSLDFEYCHTVFFFDQHVLKPMFKLKGKLICACVAVPAVYALHGRMLNVKK